VSEHEQRAALLRQRRFLILTSLAISAFYTLGIEPKNEATISGFGLTITQPERLVIALWLVWGWSLWRYGQRVYELLSALWGEIVDDVYAEDRRLALIRAKRIGNRLAAEGHFEEDMPKAARIDGRVTIEPPGDDILRSAIGEKITHFRDYIVTKEGGRSYPTLQADFEWEQGIKWGRTDHGFKMTLTRGESNWIRIRAWLHAFLRLPAFSEHIAPFLLALTAALVWLAHRCIDS